MKNLITYTAIAAAFLLSTASSTVLESCGSNSDNFELTSAVLNPSPAERGSRMIIELTGELHEGVAGVATLMFDIRGAGVHESWSCPFSSSIPPDFPNTESLNKGSKAIRTSFFFPPAFGSVNKGAEINVHIVGRQGEDDSSKRIFCVQGKVNLA